MSSTSSTWQRHSWGHTWAERYSGCYSILTLLHMVTKHIKCPKPNPGILFTDFSSAFNSIMTDGSINLFKLNTNGNIAPPLDQIFFIWPPPQSLCTRPSVWWKKFEHMGAPRLCFSSCILMKCRSMTVTLVFWSMQMRWQWMGLMFKCSKEEFLH